MVRRGAVKRKSKTKSAAKKGVRKTKSKWRKIDGWMV
jgi:hypothetical protein